MMAAVNTSLCNESMFLLGASLPGKKTLDIKYVNLELPAVKSQIRRSQLADYHGWEECSSDETDEDEMVFSGGEQVVVSDEEFSDVQDEECKVERCIYPPQSAGATVQRINDSSCRSLTTAIGDCLLLSSSEFTRNGQSPGGDSRVRWTTSSMGRRPRTSDPRRLLSHSAPPRQKLSFLGLDGSVRKTGPTHFGETRKGPSASVPEHLHPHSMVDVLLALDKAWGGYTGGHSAAADATDFKQRRRQRASDARRPHTVAPEIRVSQTSTAEYVTERVKYLLDSRASFSPALLTDELLPMYMESGTPLRPLSGRECRRFRKKVLNYMRTKKVVTSFQRRPITDAILKFKIVAKIVLTLVRLLKAITANSDSLTTKSAAEIQWQALFSDKDPHKLAFNASVFTRERAIAKLPLWSLDILAKSPETRHDADCRQLHTLFRGMRSFDKFTEKIQHSFCKTFTYMCVPEARVIIRQGHIGQNFYIIYSGSVFVNVDDFGPSGLKFVKTEAVLSKGDSFGELALLQDIRRTATIVVRETCELLVVDKNVFSLMCPRIFEIELEEKQQFMNKMSLFSNKWWHEDSLKRLALTAQIQDYKTNKVIVVDSAIEDWVYICIEGKCQVIRCLELTDQAVLSAKLSSNRHSSVLLSDEILDLLGSFPDAKAADNAAGSKERSTSKLTSNVSTKEKLLGSLGLDYINTGKRQKAFIEEMEQLEQRKALIAVQGHMTLTSYMRARLKQTTTDLVFLHVAGLSSNDIFDLSCVLNPYHRHGNSSFMLVSGGARMLRIRRDHFCENASPSAQEFTKNQAYKERYPSDDVLLKSYKDRARWEAFKGSVVRDVKSGHVILDDRKRFYRKEAKVKDRKTQIWTFVIEHQVVELHTLPKTNQEERRETSPAVAKVLGHDPRTEVTRTVPENLVLRRRRRSPVRFRVDSAMGHRVRDANKDLMNEATPVRDGKPEFDKGTRRSVTIKLPTVDEFCD